MVFHGQGELVRGLTSAAAIFAIAAIGVVVGSGRVALGAATAVLVLLTLELRYIPWLLWADPRRYQDRFRSDTDPPDVPPSRGVR